MRSGNRLNIEGRKNNSGSNINDDDDYVDYDGRQ